MSIVMPAGNKKFDWIPQGLKSLVKTASTDSEEGADVEASDDLNDSLYNAAKAHVEATKDMCDECEKKVCKCNGDCECAGEVCKCEKEASTDEEVKDAKEDEEVKEAMFYDHDTSEMGAEEVGGSDEVVEVVEEVGGSDEVAEEVAEEVAIDSVEEAVEKVEDAVSELKDAVSDTDEVHDEEVPAEIEVEVEEVAAETCQECGQEKGGMEEIIVESDPMKMEEGCMASEETETVEAETEKVEKDASTDAYEKYAGINKQNQEKLRRYWKEDLGFPPEYVDLMIANSEK